MLMLDSDNVQVGPTPLTDTLQALENGLNFCKQNTIGVQIFGLHSNDNPLTDKTYTKLNFTEDKVYGYTEGLKFNAEDGRFYVRGDISGMLMVYNFQYYFGGTSMANTANTLPKNVRMYIRPYYWARGDGEGTPVAYTSHSSVRDRYISNSGTFDLMGILPWYPAYDSTESFELRAYVDSIDANDTLYPTNNSTSKLAIFTLYDGKKA